MSNVTLSTAIQWAYHVSDHQVSGPGWIAELRYDISAKAAGPAAEDQLRLMLQALLAERWNVALHREKKDLTVYALTVAKGGIKMTLGNPDGKMAVAPTGGGRNVTGFTAQDVAISEIVETLSRGRPADVPPMVDLTGLTGRYNFTVDASAFMQGLSGEANTKGTGPLDLSAIIPAVQEILEKQLGLHAELRKASVDMLIVDRAERVPTQN
jgi:uncharacterized protein (TIGR03435 family)